MEKKYFVGILLAYLLFSNIALGQVRMSDDNTTVNPDNAAILELKTVQGKGLLLPRVSNTSLIASPKAGMMVYSTTDDCVMYYSGTRWMSLCDNAIPSISSFLNDIICASRSATLSATPSPATSLVRWYSSPTSSTILFTGPSYTTPVLSATTTYYAEAYDAALNYASPRTAVTATVNPLPLAPAYISFSLTTVNLNETFTATATPVSDATSYNWTFPAGLTGSLTTATNVNVITGATAGTYNGSSITVQAVNACGASTPKAGSGTITVGNSTACGTGGVPGAFVFKGTTYQTHMYGSACWMITNSKEGTPKTTTFNATTTNANPYSNGYWYLSGNASYACPDGWRLPSDQDATNLMYYVNRDKGVTGKYWFGSYTAGFYVPSGWGGAGSTGAWWTTSGNDFYTANGILTGPNPSPNSWLSVRCVKN